MAKRIFYLIERIALLATQQGGYASKQELVKTLTIASQQAFNALTPAKAPRAVGPGLNRAMDNRLHPLLRELVYTATITTQPQGITDGRFQLPEQGYVSFYDIAGAESVEEVPGHAWLQILKDPIEGPDATHYKVRDAANQVVSGPLYIIVPTPTLMVVNYYAYPTEPVYFETVPTQSTPAQYDDTQSTDTGWGLEMEPELIVRSLRLLGLEIRDPQLQAVAAQLTAESL